MADEPPPSGLVFGRAALLVIVGCVLCRCRSKSIVAHNMLTINTVARCDCDRKFFAAGSSFQHLLQLRFGLLIAETRWELILPVVGSRTIGLGDSIFVLCTSSTIRSTGTGRLR